MNKKVLDRKELIQKFRTEGILDAALRVIARNGLEKATMEQVAEEAGISKATIYLYFRNKEDLYIQCVVDRFDRMLASMKEAIKGIEDPIEKLERIITTQLSAIDVEKDFFRVFLTERMGVFFDQKGEMAGEFRKRHSEYSGLLSGVIREGVQRGLLREIDPMKAFFLIFSMVRGMTVCKIMCGDDTPLASEAGMILDVFFNGIKITG